MKTLSEMGVYRGHKGSVWDIAFSPVEKILASASADRTIKLWNLADNTCLNTLCGHVQSALKVLWVNSGVQLVSSGADGQIRLWNLAKSESAVTCSDHDEGKVWALGYNERERKVYSGDSEATLIEWQDVTQEVERAEFEKRRKEIEEEQALLNLRYEGKAEEAAILAFKLGKNEEFVTYIENLLALGTETEEEDPVDELIRDQKEFADLFNNDQVSEIEERENERIKKIVEEAVRIDLGRLLNIIKDCNTNSYHAMLSQTILYHIIQITDIGELKQAAKAKVEKGKKHDKKNKDLVEIIDILLAYTERHAGRVDKFIKFSCFLEYLSQKMNIIMEQ